MSKIEVNAVEPQCGTTLTLGANNDTVALGTGAAFSGGIGAVKWETTPQTGSFAASAGRGYFMDTSSGELTVTLPAGAAGAIVAFSDYARNFNTNNLIITPNGSEKIGGVSASLRLTVDGQALTLVYVDSTKGWINVQNAEDTEAAENFISASGGTEVTDGNFKLHVFTGPGTFTVSSLASTPSRNDVDYLVVGGGGGAGAQGGGGGAGGYRESPGSATCYTASPLGASPATAITVTATGFPIAVGGGGAGSTSAPAQGVSGVNSSFSSITSAGGGGGGSDAYSPDKDGANGGSGGGGGWLPGPASNNFGTGNTPSVTPSQGNNGGSGYPQCSSHGGGGGGGALAVGCNGSAPKGGNGGAGANTGILGSAPQAPTYGTPGPAPGRYFAGGGGGNANPGYSGGGTGGSGGGGNGADPSGTVTNGSDNTGGGAGSKHNVYSSPYTNGNGGSGIVIIRYKFQ